MPKGIIIMKYNNKSGIAIKACHPKDTTGLPESALMHIFNIHEFSKEAGITSITVENLNIVTSYSGSDTDYFIVLMLNLNEDPDDYEDSLDEISHKIFKNLDNDNYIDMLPSFFKKISNVSNNEKN
ncbi:MAG: hypothetical protein ACFFA0_03335 [Promethearchaeota archaeon]